MKLKVVWRKLYDYVRYNLKEIAFPSSLPDPPHIKKRRKLTWEDRFCVSLYSLFTELCMFASILVPLIYFCNMQLIILLFCPVKGSDMPWWICSCIDHLMHF
eukprot:TRINITY_DN695_c1_g1_i2.p1 TRINITY_DN695_c1_g1~~TRINITY_DN695_c1_g1_i2.p1  ORF type:complete len:102 (+),score=13.44 TRINITY_DN695_c1_g1_i2:1145-1450(+)